MRAKNTLNKVFSFILAASMAFMVFTAAGTANAQSNSCATSTLGAVFGCSGLLDSSGGINVSSIVQLVFRIILYAAVLWTVWNVVLAGIKIAGAKEDADKRKEGIQAVINAVIGLVVALLAFGIVTTVTRNIGASNVEITSTPCTAKNTGVPANSPNLTFTGFVSNKDSDTCVLMGSDGKTPLYWGCISGKTTCAAP